MTKRKDEKVGWLGIESGALVCNACGSDAIEGEEVAPITRQQAEEDPDSYYCDACERHVLTGEPWVEKPFEPMPDTPQNRARKAHLLARMQAGRSSPPCR